VCFVDHHYKSETRVFRTAQGWQNGSAILLPKNKHRLEAGFLIGILP
jgi:hypothetical protein